MNVYEKALKLLKIRPHHSEELTKKLLLRGYSRDEVNDVIQKITQERLIDNASFAQMYLDELLRNKTLGYFGFKSKLMQRGITSKEADELLKKSLSIEDELEIARRIVSKDNSDKVKLAQKLQRKGFRADVIREAIK